jgi:hypothetical protein
MPGSDYCRVHRVDLVPIAVAGGQQEGLKNVYSQFLKPDDLVALVVGGTDATLDDEIAFTRAVIRRLSKLMEEAESITDACRLANTLFQGTGRVANLLRTQQALSSETADSVAAAIAGALDELGGEWGIRL